MRGTVARRLRNQARIIAKDMVSGLMINKDTGQIVWNGYRRVYKILKKNHTV